MLATLTLLTAVAVAITVLHLGPRWVAAPPAFMLAGLLVLLREAAHSDSERARRRSPARAHPPAMAERKQDSRRRAGAVPAGAPAGVAATARVADVSREADVARAAEGPVTGEFPEVSAQVIDISARMQDQLYDQYSDAAERAVGD
jgi:hypothetical protein